jgi:Abortive infection C-terminus
VSDLNRGEKYRFERLLDMGTGYVLNFSNRTFDEFVSDSTGRNIYDSRYDRESGSKANRLRQFWEVEGNSMVAKLMGDMLEHGVESKLFTGKEDLLEACRKIVARLRQDSPVAELDELSAISDERDFDKVAKAVREAMEKNEPESALDPLHTFVIKYVRTLCTQHGLIVTRDKPLHSLFGEYVKRLREEGHIESEMTLRILKSNISTLEAFNEVRNNRTLAHDNPILQYDEALLIFNHVAGSIRFLRSVEAKQQKQEAPAVATEDDFVF